MIDATTILGESAVVLLDFDGPVTLLMPAPMNRETADACRSAMRDSGNVLPEEIATTSNHLAVIRWAGEHAPSALADVEAAAVAAEVAAAHTCIPTQGAHEMLMGLYEVGVPVVIVSNNAADAIDVYLHKHDMAQYVHTVIGRPAGRPDLMKPDPHSVLRALEAVNADASSAVMIGDSVSDIEVALKTGVRTIGYAKTPIRGEELRHAHADAITPDMGTLVPA